ncbi:MAG: RHS repeat protein, partial [Planctomycetes bacterium]|nr:RHS repeat protein [Planctomycetota bacterium]
MPSGCRRRAGIVAGFVAGILSVALGAAGDPPAAARTRWMEIPGDGKVRPARTAAMGPNENWSSGWANYAGSVEVSGGDETDILNAPESLFKFRENEKNRFPVNFGFLESPIPGDFLPVARTLGAHTLALVPNRLAAKPTSWNGLFRPTLNEAVDLVTGVPLAQFSDVSLPFNGTTFRLMRTRSATRLFTGRDASSPAPAAKLESRFWDWCGSGWMMNENPLFIIDSTLADDVGTDGLPRCYFWLDAFHSIPFDWVDAGSGRGSYDCGPRFRASLRASRLDSQGVRRYSDEAGGPVRYTDGPLSGQWQDYPDRFEVRLFDEEITYEITPMWQDMPSWPHKWLVDSDPSESQIEWTSMHERPLLPVSTDANDSDWAQNYLSQLCSPWICNPVNSAAGVENEPVKASRGLGAPYIGLVTRIHDNFRNRVEIDYAPLSEWEDTTAPSGQSSRTQWTTQTGMVREVRLKSGENTTHWTLLYAYRPVVRPIGSGGTQAVWNSWSLARQMAHCDPVLDTVYVFAGELSTDQVTLLRSPGESIGLSTDASSYWPRADNDVLNAYIGNHLPMALRGGESGTPETSSGLADASWVYRIRYSYEAGSTNGQIFGMTGVLWPPVLVRSEVEQAPEAGADPLPSRNYAFLYDSSTHPAHTPWLSHIIDDRGITKAAEALQGTAATHEDEVRKVLALPRGFESATVLYAPDMHAEDIHDNALVWYRNSTPSVDSITTTNGWYGSPSFEDLEEDGIFHDPGRLFADNPRGTVSAVALSDAGGRRHYYRITRLLQAPAQVTDSQGEFHIHRQYALADHAAEYMAPMRSIFHSPYWWQAFARGNQFKWPATALEWPGGGVAAQKVEYSEERWIAIVDEFTDRNAFKSDSNEPITAGSTTRKSFFKNSVGRRIVGMTPLGNVLWEKSYDLHGGRFAETGNTGLTERFVYKSAGDVLSGLGVAAADIPKSLKSEQLLVEKKSVGYAAAALSDGNELPPPVLDGLIHVFKHAVVSPQSTRPLSERLKLVAVAIKKGDSGAEYFQQQTVYSRTDPTVQLAAIQFTAPSTQIASVAYPNNVFTVAPGPYVVSRSTTNKPKDSSGNYIEYSTRVISQHHLRTPDSTTPYYDVGLDFTGSSGQTVWAVSAFLAAPDSLDVASDPDALVKFTYTQYDSLGRVRHTWEDIDPASPPAEASIPASDLALIPSTLIRKSPAGPASLHTEYLYDSSGLSDVIHPNGTRWARRITGIPDTPPIINAGKPITRIFTFNSLIGSGNSFTPQSMCKIEDYGTWETPSAYAVALLPGEQSAEARPHATGSSGPVRVMLRSRNVWFDSPVDIANVTNYLNYTEAPGTSMEYDSAGRLKKVKDLDLNWAGDLQAEADILDNGERVRVKELDGNTTLQIRNTRGQITRTYTGTSDSGWNDNAYTAPDDCAQSFDMILTGRTEFGTGSHNALLPTKSWKYLETPKTSEAGWSADNLLPFGEAPASDPAGELTETSYDWRMRPVRVDTYGPGATRPRQSTRLTYLDHADRTVLEASFASGTLGDIAAIDPSLFEPSKDCAADAATLVSDILSLNPSSLVETRYFDDGTVRERLTYRTHGTGYTSGSSQFTAERYGYGMGGTQIFTQQPGTLTQRTRLDNMGRTRSESSVLPRTTGGITTYDYELSRTEYGYDADGQVIVTDRWERIMPGGSGNAPGGTPELTAANAVRTRSETWYDAARHVVATVEFGTESSDNTFANPPSLVSLDARVAARRLQAGSWPTVAVPGINNGSQYAVEANGSDVGAGLVTAYRYDRAGNKIASATPRTGVGIQTGNTWIFTRSVYDPKGRLYKQIDDAAGLRRETQYTYWLGRVVEIKSPRVVDESVPGADTTWQTQGVAYGAQIVAE